MAKFRFSLATVLDLRKRREESALRGLGDAQRALQAEIGTRERLAAALESGLIRREELGREPVSSEAFRLEQAFIDGTKVRIGQADHRIARAGKQVNRAMAGYLSARRGTRAVETIRDQRLIEFKRDQAKREQRLLDDLFIMRARLAEDAG